MIIPHEKLSPEALENLIGEFVTREGTDSGYAKGSLEMNVARIRGQLQKKLAFIVYDEKMGTCNIVSAEFLEKHH
jgi:uncharacterized protein YheU (UPF0270 family)